MGLRHVQVCDRCGAARELGSNESPKNGGWRELNAGSLEATFCNRCVRKLVEEALASAAIRPARGLGGAS